MVSSAKRKKSIRFNLKKKNSSGRLRLSVHRSGKHIYAQIIDDVKGETLVHCSSLDKSLPIKDGNTKSEIASSVGSSLASKAKESKISEVYFDRGCNIYHGRIKSLADSARLNGLIF